jgi:Fur family ferric uptake transcriptional regulator
MSLNLVRGETVPTDDVHASDESDIRDARREPQRWRMSRGPRPPRDTPQRRTVLAALTAAGGGFRSVQALHEQIRASGHRIGLTTTYRILYDLVGDATVDTIRGEDGQQLFHLTRTTGHHHHLVCRSCGRSIDVASDTVETWAADLAAAHGFADLNHAIDLFGLCTGCQPDQ